MSDLKIPIDKIKDIMVTFEKSDIDELFIKEGDFSIKMSSKKSFIQSNEQYLKKPLDNIQNTYNAQESSSEEPIVLGNIVKSPIVGTFYTSPEPDREPFVSVGTKVKKGDVLFVIESMKLMNEIQSDFDGEILEIFIENGVGVEFNQPIMKIG